MRVLGTQTWQKEKKGNDEDDNNNKKKNSVCDVNVNFNVDDVDVPPQELCLPTFLLGHATAA